MKKRWIFRIGILALIFFAIFFYKKFSLEQYLSLEFLKTQQNFLYIFYLENTAFTLSVFFLLYILATALSVPGAAILTLAAGAIFGLTTGVVLVSFASTIGATLAFLTSRFLFHDFVQNKFQQKLTSINKGFKKDGGFYLFSLRLIPIFPFFMINLLMGVTTIKAVTYYWVSQLGMLPATIVFVNAGTQLSNINSINDIFSPRILLSLALIGILPLISRMAIGFLHSRKYLCRYKKPKKYDYNIVVIGGGSAGLVSAYIASVVKAKVALIEKDKMGGDCLNTGCVPSKTLIKSAKIFHSFKNANDYGFDSLPVKVNFSNVMGRVKNVINEIEPHDSVDRYTKLGVNCIQGEAKIISPYEIKVDGKNITTKNIIIATGASPFVPPIPGLNDIPFLTSETVWNLKELPAKLVILGGGAIGCELAQSFSRLGSQVIIVERGTSILGKEDDDVSQFITKKFHKEGISIRVNHTALRVEKTAKTLICEHLGKEVAIPFSEIFIALGRKANIKGFGLEDLGIEISSTGTIVADEYMRTTHYPNIFVCGDVTGPYQFTHTASHQAWYAVINALFSPWKKFKVDYRVIPWCTFTDPEVARVGLSEKEAVAQKIPYQVSHYGIDDLDRAITENENYGFIKVLTEPGKDKILGVIIVGSRAGDIISEYVTAMKYGIGLNKILGTIHIYPTFSEANKFVAGVWKKANAPQKVLNFLEKYYRWHR